MLTEVKKADRERMATMIETLCISKGAQVVRIAEDLCGPKEIVLEISMPGIGVTVDFDGSKGVSEDRDVYCMPWTTVTHGGARMTDAFGRAVGASVNPHHRAKCMGFARGIDALLARLAAALDCIAQGQAFEQTMAA